jgi:hypothetical protein
MEYAWAKSRPRTAVEKHNHRSILRKTKVRICSDLENSTKQSKFCIPTQTVTEQGQKEYLNTGLLLSQIFMKKSYHYTSSG